MTKPNLRVGNQVRVGSGVPALTAFCTYFGYIIWQNMELRGIRKRESEFNNEYIRRVTEMSEEGQELMSLLRGGRSQD